MRTPVQPDRQEGRGAGHGRGAHPAPRTSPRAKAAYLVVGAAVLAAGAPGLVGALRGVSGADPEERAQAASALQVHGVLLALCAVLAVGVVVYAARGVRAPDGAGTGTGEAAAEQAAELAAARAELAAAKENHVVERDSLLRERAALTERIGGLQASVQGTFVGLSRRTLGLVERQLSFIDELEAHEQEPGTLDTLFRLDHLAACMRRHSENLLVLAGADHRGTRRANVPLIDVLRAAVGEIESYQRVVLSPDLPQVHVTGFASGDASHLLAELLENATSCSRPESEVLLTGRLLGTGDLLLVVRDEGIGISPAGRVDDLNVRLADTDPGPAPREALGLGLYVVARLAARHGVGVELRPRDRGVDAEVRLPGRLLVGGAADGAVDGGGAAGFAGVGAVGGGAAGSVGGAAGAVGVTGGVGAGGGDAAAAGGAGHAVPVRAAGGAERESTAAAYGTRPVPGSGTDAGAAGVRDGSAAPVRPAGGAAPVRVGAQRSGPPPEGGVRPATPPFASARPAVAPRTGGWVRAEAGMLPRRQPGSTVSGGAVAPLRHGTATGTPVPAGAGATAGAAVHGAVPSHAVPGQPAPAHASSGHPAPGHPAPGHPAPVAAAAAAGHPPAEHTATAQAAPGHPAFEHPAPGHPAPGHPAVLHPGNAVTGNPATGPAALSPVPAGRVAAPGPAAGAPAARAAAPQRGAESAGGWPAAPVRAVVAVPAQAERRGVDAREVRRLLGGLQQGSRDGRRAAAAEAGTWDAKEQGAST
ncbi:ATP-binding protein [Streptomyces sp. CMB-StM0423]|uniref:ATP-binding protein n=1 Tax=Streptomyces sp. CMB-StM0423 TaxID=2059884 RepID=UPI000C711512|nr:ATP-binding protein [Streptomyces sp. CMB-StM0423]AUH40662.1 ATP-binding protein [Streptomyces sp. CMB-StM0423]